MSSVMLWRPLVLGIICGALSAMVRSQLTNPISPSRSNALYGPVVVLDIEYGAPDTTVCDQLTQSWNCFVGQKPDMVLR